MASGSLLDIRLLVPATVLSFIFLRRHCLRPYARWLPSNVPSPADNAIGYPLSELGTLVPANRMLLDDSLNCPTAMFCQTRSHVIGGWAGKMGWTKVIHTSMHSMHSVRMNFPGEDASVRGAIVTGRTRFFPDETLSILKSNCDVNAVSAIEASRLRDLGGTVVEVTYRKVRIRKRIADLSYWRLATFNKNIINRLLEDLPNIRPASGLPVCSLWFNNSPEDYKLGPSLDSGIFSRQRMNGSYRWASSAPEILRKAQTHHVHTRVLKVPRRSLETGCLYERRTDIAVADAGVRYDGNTRNTQAALASSAQRVWISRLIDGVDFRMVKLLEGLGKAGDGWKQAPSSRQRFRSTIELFIISARKIGHSGHSNRLQETGCAVDVELQQSQGATFKAAHIVDPSLRMSLGSTVFTQALSIERPGTRLAQLVQQLFNYREPSVRFFFLIDVDVEHGPGPSDQARSDIEKLCLAPSPSSLDDTTLNTSKGAAWRYGNQEQYFSYTVHNGQTRLRLGREAPII
ncbi:hypothetical protein SISNIDRAFT_470294 [Sistotremastrum niveocremeum HHB9708]|uniref:Uncharacterized protein n=1 Tax=Sistotremastrum niveocremeum HHB9708 TaxID=1314777 RepID=A0A164P2T5_9AGAM|nr:hypothetical protein SISNIDRAFT_470294 [Sistotremastrum niveocremeum HHB9708]